MTTKAYQLYDGPLPHVHSVTVVHPPYGALIIRARLVSDNIAGHIDQAGVMAV